MILATQNNIKFVIVSIKFVIVRATFPRIMRAHEDRHKQSLYMTEIRLLSGWFPENQKGNKREKDKNNPPLRGAEGVQRKREESELFRRVHK